MYCRLSSMLARQREPRKNLPCGLCKPQLTMLTHLQSLRQSAFTHTASNSNFSAKVTILPCIAARRSSTRAFKGDTACFAAVGCVSMLGIAHCQCAAKKLACSCRGRGAKNLRHSNMHNFAMNTLSRPVTQLQSRCASMTSRLNAMQASEVNASSKLCCCPGL